MEIDRQGLLWNPTIDSRKVLLIPRTIQLGGLTVTFLKSRHESGGSLDAYEMTIPTTNHVVVPHFHRHYDETIFGVDGITTWTVDGTKTEIGPGGQLFIPRGSRHSYANLHSSGARVICLVTPGLLGPEYFYELSYAMDDDGPMDYAAIGLVMSRYGIVPVHTSDSPALPLLSPFQKSKPAPMPNILGAN